MIPITESQAQKDKKKKKKALVEVNVNTKDQNKTETTTTTQPIQVVDNTAIVEAKGVGIKREDALQDALRNAVGQAVGVSISSETRVENFVVLQDAIASRSQGYISKYDVLSEVPFPDRYELTVKAIVSLSPLKADINLLAKSIGGIRFLVMYDDRNIPSEEIVNYDYAVERVNEFLSNKGYRYIEKKRFDELKKEARGIGNEIAPTQEKYIQHLGMMSDAQFIIFISKIHTASKSEAFDTQTSTKFIVEIKSYDNCTAEGLGTTTLESGYHLGSDITGRMHTGIQEAVKNDFDKLLGSFTRYIGSWVNNGTPFELRFYQVGTYRDFRTLKTKLQEDPNFGGDMEIVSIDNYTKLNCTFKNKPDQLADKILDIADAIPELKVKILDIRLIYGRQLNFAPQKVVVPELQIAKPQ
ncbi:MAG: hypothetical protein CVU05_00510 [Bacteroidetes bacterium HGW-Bacteroidetes-21]|nr:MAG: hypothetical protein CVU05_00510 [Bacteroidetes bacterium HGW-Bacteroidetes-21]